MLVRIVFATVACAVFSSVVAATTFTVDSTGDSGDSNTADGACDDGLGNCTLRAAIEQANAVAGLDTIHFHIPGPGPHTIQPVTELPIITDPVLIDGYTQPGASPNTNPPELGSNAVLIIELDGSSLPLNGAHSLSIVAGHSTVRGMVMNRLGSSAGASIDLSGNGGNTIEGNFIGTDVTGTTIFGFSFSGSVLMGNGSSDNTIGGVTSAARNVLSFVRISGDTTTNNTIAGNFIGTDVTGTTVLGAGSTMGVSVENSPNNVIGGTTPGARNIISGNSIGVFLNGSSATGNQIQGNYIGTDVTGALALGNSSDGVFIVGGASNNAIGGTLPGAGNVISANDRGVVMGISPADNRIEGNFIGTQADGVSPLGNARDGIFITKGTPHNSIGGTDAGAGNTIAFNGGHGVVLHNATEVTIRGNSIHSNMDLGIDLGGDGITPNDDGDADTGPNDLQNFPVLTSASSGAKTITITGTLNSTPDTDFALEFFSNSTCDPFGHGEGELFLGSSLETTLDGDGNVSFTVDFETTVPVGQFITATATNPAGNTSEFSACVSVIDREIPAVSLWGLVAMALLVSSAGTIVFGRRCPTYRSYQHKK